MNARAVMGELGVVRLRGEIIDGAPSPMRQRPRDG